MRRIALAIAAMVVAVVGASVHGQTATPPMVRVPVQAPEAMMPPVCAAAAPLPGPPGTAGKTTGAAAGGAKGDGVGEPKVGGADTAKDGTGVAGPGGLMSLMSDSGSHPGARSAPPSSARMSRGLGRPSGSLARQRSIKGRVSMGARFRCGGLWTRR